MKKVNLQVKVNAEVAKMFNELCESFETELTKPDRGAIMALIIKDAYEKYLQKLDN